MPRLLTAACLSLLMLLTACASDDAVVEGTEAGTEDDATPGSSGGDSSEDMEREPVDPADDGVATADELAVPATGVLGLDEVEGGCLYLEVDGERYELQAGPQADVAIDPANGVVADLTGDVIARAGDTVTVDGILDPGIVTFCQVGPVLVATSVSAG